MLISVNAALIRVSDWSSQLIREELKYPTCSAIEESALFITPKSFQDSGKQIVHLLLLELLLLILDHARPCIPTHHIATSQAALKVNSATDKYAPGLLHNRRLCCINWFVSLVKNHKDNP